MRGGGKVTCNIYHNSFNNNYNNIYLTRRNNNYWCKSGRGCRLVMVVVECIMGHGCAISKRLRLEIILSPSPPANGIAEQVFKILKTNKIIIGVRIQYYLILGWDVVAFCAQFFFHNYTTYGYSFARRTRNESAKIMILQIGSKY